jgi:pyruvate dehydrogenase E2 component (dihydrolipoamide acetyltransferase)/2-oxoisovalerate dehydrogenase E2 component (dihydrolipoyl transacylase)
MEFRLPELGEGVYEAEFISWRVKPGDAVKRGQALMEVMTDKATMEVPSPFVGTVGELRAEAGQQVKVGDVILTYQPAGEAADIPERGDLARETETTGDGAARPAEAPVHANGGEKAPVSAPVRGKVTVAPESVRAAPSVRYMARKLGIDLSRVRGSGPGGRILIDDLAAHAPAAEAKRPPVEARPDYGKAGTRVKLHGLRRKIAEHMVHSKRTVPHYAYVDECDVTELVRLRDAFREPYARRGVRLTYLAFFVKAVGDALKDVPIVNASLDESAGEIVLHDRYHVGVADDGHDQPCGGRHSDADQKDLAQVARDVERLSGEARTGRVKRDDLVGGTFTVTSIGGIGGLISTPVINHPEVAILGVGKVVKRPVFDAAGAVRPADLVYLSFSFDHRVVDGAVGAAFGNAVIRRLQKPAEMLARV